MKKAKLKYSVTDLPRPKVSRLLICGCVVCVRVRVCVYRKPRLANLFEAMINGFRFYVQTTSYQLPDLAMGESVISLNQNESTKI